MELKAPTFFYSCAGSTKGTYTYYIAILLYLQMFQFFKRKKSRDSDIQNEQYIEYNVLRRMFSYSRMWYLDGSHCRKYNYYETKKGSLTDDLVDETLDTYVMGPGSLGERVLAFKVALSTLGMRFKPNIKSVRLLFNTLQEIIASVFSLSKRGRVSTFVAILDEPQNGPNTFYIKSRGMSPQDITALIRAMVYGLIHDAPGSYRSTVSDLYLILRELSPDAVNKSYDMDEDIDSGHSEDCYDEEDCSCDGATGARKGLATETQISIRLNSPRQEIPDNPYEAKRKDEDEEDEDDE